MNNSYSSYVNYIQSTNYYNNLSSALTKIGTISDNVDSLINALGKNNGHNITSAIDDLQSFKTNLGLIATYYGSLKSSLKSNAEAYDTLYQQTKTNDYTSCVYRVNHDRVESPNISYNFFTDLYDRIFTSDGASFNVDNIIPASKSYVRRETSISSDFGYVGYIKVARFSNEVFYNLKCSFLNKSFDIETGTPEDCLESSPICRTDNSWYYLNKDGTTVRVFRDY